MKQTLFIFVFPLSLASKNQNNDSRARPGAALERALRAPRDPFVPADAASSDPGRLCGADSSCGGAPQGRAAVEGPALPFCIGIVFSDVPVPRRLRGAPPGVEGQRRLLRLRGRERRAR